jgi:hypothetical protein
MPRLLRPSLCRLAPLAGTLALAAACADLPTAAAPAARPAADLGPASTFTGSFDTDPARTYCTWGGNDALLCGFRVVGIGGVPAGALATVRLRRADDFTYRCQNAKTGRLDTARTLAGHVSTIGVGFPNAPTEIESTLGTVAILPATLCRKNQVLAEWSVRPRQATLLFGYELGTQFVVSSSTAFSAPGA